MKKVKLIYLVLFICCGYSLSINAQVKLLYHSIGNGSFVISGDKYISSGTIGQNVIGITSNGFHSNNIGFWYQYENIITDIIKSDYTEIPDDFNLFQNYPNPFNPTTTIKYSLPKEIYVNIIIFDILGREVATLFSDTQKAGNHIVEFNASLLSSGVYFYRMKAGEFMTIKKMLLSK